MKVIYLFHFLAITKVITAAPPIATGATKSSINKGKCRRRIIMNDITRITNVVPNHIRYDISPSILLILIIIAWAWDVVYLTGETTSSIVQMWSLIPAAIAGVLG